MKKDRILVVLLVAAHWSLFNFLPTNVPQLDMYGRGFPMKWEYDPGYRNSGSHRTSTYGPRDQWRFDTGALFVNIAVGIVALGLALAWNEIWQTSRGNRPAKELNLG
jgi:hypothetical protein